MKKLGKRFEVFEETVKAYDFCDCNTCICGCATQPWYGDWIQSDFNTMAGINAFDQTFK